MCYTLEVGDIFIIRLYESVQSRNILSLFIDYSTEEDRHLMTAEVPSLSPDVLIVESTFGIADHERREDREYKFTSAVEEVASRNKGCCLIPVFALGRAQELLLILDEYWQANHHLQDIPIYYATGMSSQAVSQLSQTFRTLNICLYH